VRHIERPQSVVPQAAVPEVTYEDVRRSFLGRLHGEHTRLAGLADALNSGAMASASAFGELEGFAHRLRGAAAVFDFSELRDAAKVLEVAANACVVGLAPANEPLVQAAIRSLVEQLTGLTCTPPTDLAMAPIPTN
jgi:hypothetical protein